MPRGRRPKGPNPEGGAVAIRSGDELRHLDGLGVGSRVSDNAGDTRSVPRAALVASDQLCAEQLFEESVLLARESGDPHLIALTTMNLSALALEQGEFDRAVDLATEAAAPFSIPAG